MVRQKTKSLKSIDTYTHEDTRLNNPTVELSAKDNSIMTYNTYIYDPHLNPELQWAGKAERTSFDVPNLALHTQEYISPINIIEQMKRQSEQNSEQLSLLHTPKKWDRQKSIEFYQHEQGWANRLIAGDSLLVMNSLLQKEQMAGQVQTVYFDPPYGIKFGSNFQAFTDKKEVKDKHDDLTREPEMIKAFRDTWELGIHSYLSYMRDRLLLAKELLHESGSVFVQISDENLHRVRNVMDEVFGEENFISLITFRKTNKALGAKNLGIVSDYLVHYAKEKPKLKFNKLFTAKSPNRNPSSFKFVEVGNQSRKSTDKEVENYKDYWNTFFTPVPLTSSGFTESCTFSFEFQGNQISAGSGKSWGTTFEGIQRLIEKNRIFMQGKTPFWKQYLKELPTVELDNIWNDTRGELRKNYVVQTSEIVIQRCLLMSSNPGDLVLDITCGSGTTATVAEQWGRRWITCDTSRVAIALAKQRLMTSIYPFYKQKGSSLKDGFIYKTVPHVTLKQLAQNLPHGKEELVDQPEEDKTKLRVTGAFTVESLPCPRVSPMEGELPTSEQQHIYTDTASKQDNWMREMQSTGIRGKQGNVLKLGSIERLEGTHYVHAKAFAEEESPKRVYICFGDAYHSFDKVSVERSLDELEHIRPQPDYMIYASFNFDAEAARHIESVKLDGVQFLKVQMNTDLETKDLAKQKGENESFWFIGQPDVQVKHTDEGLLQAEVKGYDYFDPTKGRVESGNQNDIAMWLLDQDYNGRFFVPSQVFFPLAGLKDGWNRLGKDIKALLDPEYMERFSGLKSRPFSIGEEKQIALKIIDKRGVESMRVLDLKKEGLV